MWANSASGEIVAAPRDLATGLPANPGAIAVGQDGPVGLAALGGDPGLLPWINGDGGELMALER